MKIIFIASLSHSGSTLLDLMLNAHPRVVSVGELKQLVRFTRFTKSGSYSCTCGTESIWDCPFWSRVSALTENEIGRTIGELNVENYKDLEGFHNDSLVLFNAVAAAAGKDFIVDSSKDCRRLGLLMQNPTLEVFPVFLLRDPRGQVCSTLNKQRRAREKGKPVQKSGKNVLRAIADYVITNREIYSIIRDCPHTVVKYEELVQHPESTLTTLMEAVGLNFNPVQLGWAEKERHNVGGNRMRKRKTNALELDDTWRHTLSISQRFLIDVGTIAGRYPALKFL